MKKIIILLLLILIGLHSGCLNNSNFENPSVNAKILDKVIIEGINQASFDCYNLKIELRNRSDSTIRFWTMTCSWEENWILNNDSLGLLLKICDSNYPFISEIKPGQVLEYQPVLIVNKSIKFNSDRYKIGFAYIKENEVNDINSFRNILNDRKKNRIGIVWGIVK